MDPSSAPQTTPFVLPHATLYTGWDHKINPRYYFEVALKKTTHTVCDDRSYLPGVLKYLEARGAQVVESSLRMEDSQKAASNTGLLELDDIINSFGDWAGGSYLFWYANNLVSVQSNGDALYTIETVCVQGAPCVHDEFKPFLYQRQEASVSVLLQGMHGLTTKQVDFEPPIIDDLDLNYGTGFTTKVFNPIVAKLNKKKAGLVLLHGSPGTGKSTLIKYLTTKLDRKFIFIPVGMAGELSSPAFLKVLMNEPEAILVLEDAEQALQSREKDFWNSAVISTILNLADGILGTLLNISVIATYNADKQTVDPALLRKGRLLFDYNFGKLSVDDANRFAKHLGKEGRFSEPTSLADIYNLEDDTNYVPPVEKTMGFGFTTPK